MRKSLLVLFTGMLLFACPVVGQVRDARVTGKVVDLTGNPVIGATIHVKGTTTGTASGDGGSFSLPVPADGTLVVSFIGYKTTEIAVNNRTEIRITLEEEASEIEDVVVVAYGTMRKVDLTGAVTVVDPEKAIGTRPVGDLARGLQGASPGLDIITSSGNLGVDPQIYLRGSMGSLNQEATPMILLDGVEVPSLMAINPTDIETITVLKDASSTAVYGTRGAFGVILLTSKKGARGPKKITVSYDNNFAWSSPVNTPEIADGADAAEYLMASGRRTNPSMQSYNILGAYYDDLSIQRMRQWKQNYGDLKLGDEMVEGRDFERRGGNVYYYRPWDVDDIFLDDASPQQRHNLSVRGSSDKSSYFGSISWLDQNGLVKITPKADNYQRFTGNVRFETQVNKWFKAKFAVLTTRQEHEYPFFRLAQSDAGGSRNEYWFNIYRYPETYPYGTINGYNLKNVRSELEQAHMDKSTKLRHSYTAGGVLTPVKGLSVDFQYTYSLNENHEKSAATPISGVNQWLASTTLENYEESFFTGSDFVRLSSFWDYRHTGTATATYTDTFREDHRYTVMAGGEMIRYESEGHRSDKTGLLFPSQPELGLAGGTPGVSGSHGRYSTLYFFGRLLYSYKNKYTLQASVGINGASNFPPKHKWGTFPSVSAGWNISEEKFMSSPGLQKVVSFLKLRASYGASGNSRFGMNSVNYLSLYSPASSGWFIGSDDMRTVSGPSTPSSNLSWEKIVSYDIGLEARFFKNTVGIELDWYQRRASDMVIKSTDDFNGLGASPPWVNEGELVSNGYEITLSYNKVFRNGLAISVKGTLHDYKSKITKHPRLYTSIAKPNPAGRYEWYQGMTVGEIWGFYTDRLFTEDDFSGNDGNANPTWYYAPGVANQDKLSSAANFHYGPGDVKYRDLDDDGEVSYGEQTTDKPGDMRVIGNSEPRYTYGFTLGAEFKGFDAKVFIQGVGKRDYWGTGALVIPNFTNNEALYANQMDYWKPDRPNAFYPRPHNPGGNNANGNYQVQTRYLLNMAYTRLKSVELGYTVPVNLTSKIGIDKVRVFVNGENLFTWDHLKGVPIDPEIRPNTVENFADAKSFGRTYPYFRTFSCGLQLSF